MVDSTFSRLINNQLFTNLTWLRFIGFEFWMVGFTPFFIGYVVSAEKLYDFDLFYGFFIVAILTSSTFVLNHIYDLELDRHNPRKEFSLLVRGTMSLTQAWILFWFLQLSCIVLSFYFNIEFLYCMLGLTFISLIYNIPPFRFKTRPQLYFFATICYLLALYCPTMAVDVEWDRKFGIETFATKVGAAKTMQLSWFFTILGVLTLLYSGIYEIFPWNQKLLLWTGWLLVLEILVHYIYLPIYSRPSYYTVAKGSIILATFEALATLLFLIIFLDLLPIG